MSETSIVKVYELAKELGIDSISLLDKLRHLNIQVKNHMSDLSGPELVLARCSLQKRLGGASEDKRQLKKGPPRVKKKSADNSKGGIVGALVASAQGSTSGDFSISQDKKLISPIIRRRTKPELPESKEAAAFGLENTFPQPPLKPDSEAFAAAEGESLTAGIVGKQAETSKDADIVEVVDLKANEDLHSKDLLDKNQKSEKFAASAISKLNEVTEKMGKDIKKNIESKDKVESIESSISGILPDTKGRDQKVSNQVITEEISKSGLASGVSKAIKRNVPQITPSTDPKRPTSEDVKRVTSDPGVASGQVVTRVSGTPTPVHDMPKPTGLVTGTAAAGPGSARPPIAPFIRPVAPRKSILKIVQPSTPTPRPVVKPVGSVPGVGTATNTTGLAQKSVPTKNTGTQLSQDKDGFRIIKMTKENLDQMAEEEAARKRGLGKETDLNPEDVRFADYRKKEMVFLPKKKKIPQGKEIRKTQITTAKAQKRIVAMKESISVQDLANQLSVKAAEIIKKLMNLGQMATANQSLDIDTATLIATEYQFEVKSVAFDETSLLVATENMEEKDLSTRPPVVTIMGHVDHGKTTLLDAIRDTNVAAGEAGGITQHMGAYTVQKNGKWITFIDTPGHEAFAMMRARGANATDIVVLVVSADDGVMPQTREAISHAQAAKVPIIVAVNKIDKPGANPEKIKQSLAELNLLAEDWGGETLFVLVSALKKTNLDKLLDAVLLQAEILDLKASTKGLAQGIILEARIEKGRGPVVSAIIKRGTLNKGDFIVSGHALGKVKALTDDRGKPVKCVLPGFAAEILGFEIIPNAGEAINATESEGDASNIIQNRIDKKRSALSAQQGKMSLDLLFSKIQSGDVKELNVVIKADVFGSVEAIRDSLQKLSTDKVKIKIIHSAAGGITESDVLLASASFAIIIGFNVRPETKARQLAESENIEIKSYSIIYKLIEDIRLAMTGLLDKKKVEKFLGRAEVRQIFSVPKIGVVAGSAVIDGKILRGANVRLLRESRVIYEGKMSSLRRFKDDAKEVATGFECGIGIENYNDLKTGDIIEAYQIEWVAPELIGGAT